MHNEQQEKLLTVAELAAKFAISRVSIRQMVINNSIPHIVVDRKPYFNENQIREWREELIKERYNKPHKRELLIGEKEKLEYAQHFRCLLCKYSGNVEVYNDDTVYSIVEKIKRDHADGSPDCKNEIQDIQILREVE